ncbi:MAG: 16S rRNA (cytosine(1402)-N(4))-methyltransferase RsmH [Candidatus Brocadiia bacterium]
MVHNPVLLNEVAELLNLQPGGVIVDGTVGFGGHFKTLLSRIQPNGRLIGIDQDCEAIAYTQEWLKSFLEQGHEIKSVDLFCDNFSNIGDILGRLKVPGVDGILLDIGVSSYQLDRPERGFSFQSDGPLDMRMNPKADLTAEMVINGYHPNKLIDIFREYGEERWAKRIALNIARAREKGRIETTTQLAGIIERSVPFRGRARIHPATRVFQALRIEVNQELNNLKVFLGIVPKYLNTGGRLGIISFHSLEDRLVKESFRNGKTEGIYRPITKKPVWASEKESYENPRSRSARLRVVERI